MRYMIVAALALTACGGGTEPSDPPVTPPVVDPPALGTFTVSGTLQDSAMGKPVAGVTVSVGGVSVVTDFLGQYSATVQEGSRTIVVSDTLYEAFSATRTVTVATTVNVPLRRHAPFLAAFNGTVSGATLTVGDLQGIATFNTSAANGSSYNYTKTGGNYFATMGAPTPTGAVSGTTSVTFSGTGTATSVLFSLKDVEGNVGRFRCALPGSACIEEPFAP